MTLGELLGPITFRAALGLALLSGVAEELLFRGALWPHLGLFGTTFLFALVRFASGNLSRAPARHREAIQP